MRLNNYIGKSGLYSRRQADALIQQRKVKVNGKIALLGMSVLPDDVVEVEGKIVKPKKDNVYIALNKPVGITCTTEKDVQGNIIDYINHPGRIFPIGRLDKDSEGLILLTDDGDIVNKILRHENSHEKEYIVTVDKETDDVFIYKMSDGVKIFNPVNNRYTTTKKCDVKKIDKKVFKITLKQGLNRQIRRMCSKLGYSVIKLKRTRIMNITVKDLAVGKWRYLTDSETERLKADIDYEKER